VNATQGATVIVYVDTSEVRPGRLDELKAAMSELAEFVEANEPQLITYQVYFSEDGTRMTVLHINPDSTSLEFHMKTAGPECPPIGEFIDMMSIDVYGEPDLAVVDQLRRKAAMLGTGTVRVHALHAGFARAPSP
jgi:quinol monooxygenase YgiN